MNSLKEMVNQAQALENCVRPPHLKTVFGHPNYSVKLFFLTDVFCPHLVDLLLYDRFDFVQSNVDYLTNCDGYITWVKREQKQMTRAFHSRFVALVRGTQLVLLKVAQNSFQHLDIHVSLLNHSLSLDITIMISKSAQSLVNTLTSFS